MSGGKIQGDQPPQRPLSSAATSTRPRKKNRKDSRQPTPRSRRKIVDTQVVDDAFGPPSADHERPRNKPGERDPSGIAPGR